MKQINIGRDISLDLTKLIDTRLLVQANSGGGKSYAIRKILESTHGHVQQIVLDIEGDFSSLREKYDYILAGKGGDIAADPKHASFLARKVLELKTDIIIDLYELKQHERIRFVKDFLDAMTNAPKDLWHPVLVILDEAHIFCPEKGSAESMSAVTDLCTRGRKRGFCAVLATQRLSKLNKDAAAECNNKLIGRTGLDIDLKRATDELGFGSNKGTELKHLEPGDFFFFGPALSKEVMKGKIGETKTNHPRAGHRNLNHKPAPSATVKSALSKLGEIAKQADDEIATVAGLKARVKELERAKPEMPKADIQKITDKAIAAAKKELQSQMAEQVKALRQAIGEVISKFGKPELELPLTRVSFAQQAAYIPPPARSRSKPSAEPGGLGQCERRILGFLASQFTRRFTKVQVGVMTGYAHSSGGFNNAISKLCQTGFINRAGGLLQIASSGLDWINENGAETPHSLRDWVSKLGSCERAIYQFLLENQHSEIAKDDIAERTSYSAGSGGFNNAISRLNTLGLIQREHGGIIKLNSEILEIAGDI